ncbi:MAG: hypothetical protein Q7T11_09465 [Deltaproteobacteria bacterium]|nr:hypothetical protein [Deltaproteobacteria bacterium]
MENMENPALLFPRKERELFPEVLEVMAKFGQPGPAVVPQKTWRSPIKDPGVSEQVIRRISRALGSAEARYNPMANLEETEISFYNLMAEGLFMPKPVLLKNAGCALGTVASNYVLLLSDSADSLFETMKRMVDVRKQGASARIVLDRAGPVAVLKIFDSVMEVLFGGAEPWDATVMIRADHPDRADFLETPSSFKRNVFDSPDEAVPDLEGRVAGHLNLALDGSMDWKKIRETVWLAVHFLDNAWEINHSPFADGPNRPQRRKIELGLTGPKTETVVTFVAKEIEEAAAQLFLKRGGNRSVYFSPDTIQTTSSG